MSTAASAVIIVNGAVQIIPNDTIPGTSNVTTDSELNVAGPSTGTGWLQGRRPSEAAQAALGVASSTQNDALPPPWGWEANGTKRPTNSASPKRSKSSDAWTTCPAACSTSFPPILETRTTVPRPNSSGHDKGGSKRCACRRHRCHPNGHTPTEAAPAETRRAGAYKRAPFEAALTSASPAHRKQTLEDIGGVQGSGVAAPLRR